MTFYLNNNANNPVLSAELVEDAGGTHIFYTLRRGANGQHARQLLSEPALQQTLLAQSSFAHDQLVVARTTLPAENALQALAQAGVQLAPPIAEKKAI